MMLKRFLALATPPHFEDKAKTAAVVLPYRIALLTLVAILFSALPVLLVTENRLAMLVIFGTALLGGAATIWWLRRGYIQQTSIVFILCFLAIITLANILWNSSSSPALGAYTIVIFFSGMMLGKRAVLYTALASMGLAIATAVFVTTNLLPITPSLVTALPRALIHAMYYGIAASILYIAIDMVSTSVERLRENERRLQDTLNTLQSTSVSKAYLDNILRSMNNLLVVVDVHGTIQTVNPATLKVLGYAESDLVGKPLNRFYDSGENTPLQNGVEDTTGNNEADFIAANGQRIPVAYTQSVLQDEHGKATGLVLVAQDIRERRMMEAERHTAEQERLRNAMRYRALFEQTNDAVLLIDLNGKHIAANQRAADLLGYTVTELLQIPFLALLQPKDAGRKSQAIDNLFTGKPLPPHERTLIRKDGTELATEMSIELVYDADGKPMHVQCIARDITLRKRNEQQLAYQASLLQNVNDAIISTTMDNVIQSWNRAAEQVYGWKAEEVIGKKLAEVVPTEFDSDSEDFIKHQYIVRGYWRSEVKQKARDGRRLIMLSSVSILRDHNNQLLGTVTVNHDITARKHAEMELQERIVQLAALRQVDVEINSSLQMTDVLIVAMNAMQLLSDADSGYIVLKTPHTDNAGQWIVRQVFGKYADQLRLHEPVVLEGFVDRVAQYYQPELVLDFSRQPSRVGCLPTTEAQMVYPMISRGQMIGIINLETSTPNGFTQAKFDFLRIVTSRIAIALENAQLFQVSQTQLAELQTLYEKVSELEKLKTDMIRTASHDLRNPVGVVKGYIEILQDDLKDRLNPEDREHLESMRRSTMRIQAIINDILSLERLDSAVREVVDLNTLVSHVLDESKRHSQEKQQQLLTTIAPAQMLVEADPAQLREAVVNLVENAIKYTPNKGCVQVRLTRNGGTARLEVEDNGYGIPEAMQPQIFKAFYRARHKDVTDIEGTGLGLHLVKNIVERFGGQIGFTSELKRGSTFWFELPLLTGT